MSFLSTLCVCVCVYAPGNIKPCYAAVTYALSAPSLNFNFQEATESVVFHIQNSNNVIKRMHYCHPLCGAAVCTVSAWKAEGGQDESDNVPRSSVKAAKWPHSLYCVYVCVCVWHKYDMSPAMLQCVRRTPCLCDRQRGCRAHPSLDQRSPAQLDPAGTNPSSPPLNHRAANKARRQYITGMWQALAIMTLRSPLGL